VWRPCDTVETAIAWRAAIARSNGPTALVLTRQKTKAQHRSAEALSNANRGGYVLQRETAPLAAVAIATGSEVALAVAAANQLANDGIGVRVVSMPSTDTFLAQDVAYRESVLPMRFARALRSKRRIQYWYRFVGLDGACRYRRFGLSAPCAGARGARHHRRSPLLPRFAVSSVGAGNVLKRTSLDLAGKRVLIREDLNVQSKTVRSAAMCDRGRAADAASCARRCAGACRSHLGRPTKEPRRKSRIDLAPVAVHLTGARAYVALVSD
jgi:hypothetical protein